MNKFYRELNWQNLRLGIFHIINDRYKIKDQKFVKKEIDRTIDILKKRGYKPTHKKVIEGLIALIIFIAVANAIDD